MISNIFCYENKLQKFQQTKLVPKIVLRYSWFAKIADNEALE